MFVVGHDAIIVGGCGKEGGWPPTRAATLADSSCPPQKFDRRFRFDLNRFLQRRRTELVLHVHLRTEIDEQLHGICVILDGQIVQCRLTETRPQVEHFRMMLHEVARELRLTDCKLHQLDEERVPRTFPPLLWHGIILRSV
jgi:hypothetical protein